MRAFLLTWNPRKFEKSWAPEVRRLARGETVTLQWSTGGRRDIEPGDRLYLVRLGIEPRGIFASGVALRPPEEGPHWDGERRAAGELARYVDVSLDALLDPEVDLPFDPRSSPALQSMNWSPRRSGIEVPGKLSHILQEAWERHVRPLQTTPAEETTAPGRFRGNVYGSDLDDETLEVLLDLPEGGAYEGELVRRHVLHRKRERWLRKEKIRKVLRREGRLVCEVPGCGFDFFEVYGELGKEFAHVHHLKPLSCREAPEQTRIEDLAIVCANCHAMIHRFKDPLPLDAVIPPERRFRSGSSMRASRKGANEHAVRTVTENCRTLKFVSQTFEDE